MTVEDTIFSRIISREVSANIVYEDEFCLAFHDLSPQAPVHLLLIPKRAIVKLSDVVESDQGVLGHMLTVVPQIVENAGISNAFRLVINNGSGAGQTVFHLHLHILGGRDFSWPPG